jgi:hypothetical protein
MAAERPPHQTFGCGGSSQRATRGIPARAPAEVPLRRVVGPACVSTWCKVQDGAIYTRAANLSGTSRTRPVPQWAQSRQGSSGSWPW